MNKNYLEDMTGKVCLVTGASSGIGEATALELARQNATVIGIGYHPQHITEARARILAQSGREVDFIQADLSSQTQVCRVAAEFRSRYKRLDVLINNAGSFFPLRRKSVDGIEMNFALNHLAYFHLTNLLLDMLKASAPARVINVSSSSHYGNPLDFEDLEFQHRYHPFKAYGRSKFANILFSYELARRLDGTGVSVNALHPGWVATNIARNIGFLARVFMPLIQFNALRPREGAETSLYLAASSNGSNVTGSFFINRKAVKSDPLTYDREAQSRLWHISAEMTGCKGD
jgi:NAD(P)-dependent dehydrogenase (short-subunit alcohol dehydrogenase family)